MSDSLGARMHCLLAVRLAKGQATLMHEHHADSFSVMFRDTEITVEPFGGAATRSAFSAGRVGFASTQIETQPGVAIN